MKHLTGLVLAAVLLLAPVLAWGKVGGGDIVFRPYGVGNVTYSHDVHVSKAGLKCRDCHYSLYTTVEGHRKATMEEMQTGKSCGACHNGTKAFAVKANCAKCHE